jgi:Immunity protein 53
MTAQEPLAAIEAWYAAQCDGDWEHSYGLSIETLDNPGWRVRIDLHGTTHADRPFDRHQVNRDERDWFTCWVESETFHAACGPQNLTEALLVFLDWGST